MMDTLLPGPDSSQALQPSDYTLALSTAVQRANEAVLRQNHILRASPETDVDVFVGVTLTAALIVGTTASIANVGNCRTYHYRATEGLKQVTTDHTIVARLVVEGRLPPEAVYRHVHRLQLYRALPVEPPLAVDIYSIPLQPGDGLVLCSKGLWGMVRDPQIEVLLRRSLSNPARGAQALIQAALDQGCPDNGSVIVVSMTERPDHLPRH